MDLPILTFHALDEASSVISFPPRLFGTAMAKLHAAGFRALSLRDVLARLRRREALPPRAFALTFDDGYRSVYAEAFPVLARYGMSATVFLTPGDEARAEPGRRLPSLEGRPMLSWGEIREMHREGIAFGAHTLTHPDLTRLPADRVSREICASQSLIADALGTDVDLFAYPFGRYDARSRDIVSQHFAGACSDRLGLVTEGSDVFALERVETSYLRGDRLFALMLGPFFSGYLRARSVPRRIRRVLERRGPRSRASRCP